MNVVTEMKLVTYSLLYSSQYAKSLNVLSFMLIRNAIIASVTYTFNLGITLMAVQAYQSPKMYL